MRIISGGGGGGGFTPRYVTRITDLAPVMGLSSDVDNGAFTVASIWQVSGSYPGSLLIDGVSIVQPLTSGNVTEGWTATIWSADGTRQDFTLFTNHGTRIIVPFAVGYEAAPLATFTLGIHRSDNGPTGAHTAGTLPSAITILNHEREGLTLPLEMLMTNGPGLILVHASVLAAGNGVRPTTVDSGPTCRVCLEPRARAVTGDLLA